MQVLQFLPSKEKNIQLCEMIMGNFPWVEIKTSIHIRDVFPPRSWCFQESVENQCSLIHDKAVTKSE